MKIEKLNIIIIIRDDGNKKIPFYPHFVVDIGAWLEYELATIAYKEKHEQRAVQDR